MSTRKKRVLVLLDQNIVDLIRKLPLGSKSDAGKVRSIVFCFLVQNKLLMGMEVENGKLFLPSKKKLSKETMNCVKGIKKNCHKK